MQLLIVLNFICGLAVITASTEHTEGHSKGQDFELVCNGAHISVDVEEAQAKGQAAQTKGSKGLNSVIPSIAEPEWQLVFKAVSGLYTDGVTDPFLGDPYLVWERDAPYNEGVPEAKILDTSFRGHYKSSSALNWNRRNIMEVKLSLLDDTGTELIRLVFDGEGLDDEGWFSKARLLESPWEDMHTEQQNFFSPAGETGPSGTGASAIRRFYINKSYGGCPGDVGWLTILAPLGICDWEVNRETAKPIFLYSVKKTAANWNDIGDIGEASIMAVFVKNKSRYL